MSGVWEFENPETGTRYRYEIDQDGNEQWSEGSTKENQMLRQSEAARLIGVSRQAISNAISGKRLNTIDCGAGIRIAKQDVLALKKNKTSHESKNGRKRALT